MQTQTMQADTREQILNVPLDPESRMLLSEVARMNGRAAGREAARLVKRGLAPYRRNRNKNRK